MKMKKRGRQAKTHTIFRPLYTCPDKYFFSSEKSKYIYDTVSDILTQCQNELRNWQTHENESGKMVSEKLK